MKDPAHLVNKDDRAPKIELSDFLTLGKLFRDVFCRRSCLPPIGPQLLIPTQFYTFLVIRL